jgi:hypothetical protein
MSAYLAHGKPSSGPLILIKHGISATNRKVLSTKGLTGSQSNILMSFSHAREKEFLPNSIPKSHPGGIKTRRFTLQHNVHGSLEKLVTQASQYHHAYHYFSGAILVRATQAGQPERQRGCRLQNRGLRFQMKKYHDMRSIAVAPPFSLDPGFGDWHKINTIPSLSIVRWVGWTCEEDTGC